MCVKSCQCNSCNRFDTCADCQYQWENKDVDCTFGDGVQGCAHYISFVKREDTPDGKRTDILEQEKRIEEIKADTVRKMQEAIKERCIKGGIYPVFVKNVVEAVAKELLEDVTPPAKLLSLEDVSQAIKDYCCDLIDAGKDMVEVTEFNADLQKILSREIFGKETE